MSKPTPRTSIARLNKRIVKLEGLLKEVENLRYYNRWQHSQKCRCSACTIFDRIDKALQERP